MLRPISWRHLAPNALEKPAFGRHLAPKHVENQESHQPPCTERTRKLTTSLESVEGHIVTDTTSGTKPYMARSIFSVAFEMQYLYT